MRDVDEYFDDQFSESNRMFLDYHKQFKSMVGQSVIWKTSNNPNLKSPQLVIVEQSFKYFVLVCKVVYNVEAQKSNLRYAVNYSSLYTGQDSIETLELSI